MKMFAHLRKGSACNCVPCYITIFHIGVFHPNKPERPAGGIANNLPGTANCPCQWFGVVEINALCRGARWANDRICLGTPVRNIGSIGTRSGTRFPSRSFPDAPPTGVMPPQAGSA